MSNKPLIQAVKLSLSHARMGTFEAAKPPVDDEDLSALKLYAWNAQVSGALLAPLHICEVVIRNAVADALEATYGPRWPWHGSMELSLPNPSYGYNPRRDLLSARRRAPSTGKVIPEVKFVFWQQMFTQRHDGRLWNHLMRTVLPNLDASASIPVLRGRIYDDLEHVRALRNRIAHHEPIFARNLTEDFQRIQELIALRCVITAAWMTANQEATRMIAAKP